MIGMVYCRI